MADASEVVSELQAQLAAIADQVVAQSAQRFFPEKISLLGVSNGDVRKVADAYAKSHDLSPELWLKVADALIVDAGYHEHVLLGFACVRKLVRRNFDDDMLEIFHRWLANNVTNWAQCDDLCLKVIYPFFLGRPQLLTTIGHWVDSPHLWVRRAANVALIKFVRRKIGKDVYELPTSTVFDNCLRLFDDPEPYVQKSVGWFLKATAEIHPEKVVAFLEANISRIDRATLRYATEKLDPQTTQALLAQHSLECG